MRPHIYLILFGLVLGLPFVTRRIIVRERDAGEARAGRMLVVVTPHTLDIRRQFAEAFSQWHQKKYGTPVRVEYRIPGGTVDVRRLIENTYAAYRDKVTGRIAADIPTDLHVVWGGGDYFFESEIKKLGVLQPIRLDPSILRAVFPKGQERLNGVKLCDIRIEGAAPPWLRSGLRNVGFTDVEGKLTPLWVGVCLSSFGIVYNSDLYGELKLDPPKTWDDLADPRLNQLVELADPMHSGSAATTYMTVLQRNMADAEERLLRARPELAELAKERLKANEEYRTAIAAGWKRGMGQLLLIVANSRHLTDSSSQVPHDVGNGNAAAGMAIDFYARVYEETVGSQRCRYVMPHAATAITPDPVGILYGVRGETLRLAEHFVEFLLSPEGQRLWELKPGYPGGPEQRAMRRPPIRRDVYADRRGWADPDVNPFTDAGNFNQRSEWMGLVTDTRLIWGAAWIDNRGSLREAYESVLKLRAAPRQKLLADLADLPIELSDVEALAAEREQLEKTGSADEWKAMKRIEWGRKFRAHYAAVQRRAERSAEKEPPKKRPSTPPAEKKRPARRK